MRRSNLLLIIKAFWNRFFLNWWPQNISEQLQIILRVYGNVIWEPHNRQNTSMHNTSLFHHFSAPCFTEASYTRGFSMLEYLTFCLLKETNKTTFSLWRWSCYYRCCYQVSRSKTSCAVSYANLKALEIENTSKVSDSGPSNDGGLYFLTRRDCWLAHRLVICIQNRTARTASWFSRLSLSARSPLHVTIFVEVFDDFNKPFRGDRCCLSTENFELFAEMALIHTLHNCELSRLFLLVKTCFS